MKTKQDAVREWLDRPIQVNDWVDIAVPYTEMVREKVKGKWTDVPTRKVKTGHGTVIAVQKDKAYGLLIQVKTESWSLPSSPSGVPDGWKGPGSGYGEPWLIEAWVTPNTDHLGADPFVESPDIRFFNQNIDSLLHRACYSRYNETFDEPEYKRFKENEKLTYGGVNFNPYIKKLTSKGIEKVYYQRDLVWTTEQKQDLIQTIYNGGEIGKFVFRYRRFEHVEEQALETGHGYNWDCVDGKQRFHAILEFVQNKYPDRYGNYWRDLSNRAQRRFLNYDKLSFGELGEGTSDRQTIMAFLHVNVKGTPVSAEHIDKVEAIYSKDERKNEMLF